MRDKDLNELGDAFTWYVLAFSAGFGFCALMDVVIGGGL